MSTEEFLRLAPFARRAGVAVTGRERLQRLSKRLLFIWATEDTSERTWRELCAGAPCPVVRFLTSAEVEQTLGFRGTKVVGFLRSSLATSLYRACQGGPKRESQP
ncbi:MAG: hypothetical protein GX595_00985 [Lentisphaerae bacterium]|nr:hypothetical protein [Lentisphaerota bacterium]